MSGSRFLFILVLLYSTFAFARQDTAKEWSLDQLIRSQNQNYSHQNWNAFFGSAQAYRLYWWNKYPSVQMISLETLALLKLCRYEQALQLAEATETWLQKHPQTNSVDDQRKNEFLRLTEIKSLVRGILQLHPVIPTTRPTTSANTSLSEHFWPLFENQERIKDFPPMAFRVRMESYCR